MGAVSDSGPRSVSIATIRDAGREQSVFVDPNRGTIAAQAVYPDFTGDARDLISLDMELNLRKRVAALPDQRLHPLSTRRFTAPYRHPRKIWGIGLNYLDHAQDLGELVPDEPASFIKADHTIIGADDPIVLPEQSERVTVEAELGLIIGREARCVSEAEALDYVWGVCTILDQTAEDILQRNPRFLTRAKNFPTFFSFGPYLVPLEDVVDDQGGIGHLVVRTVVGPDAVRENRVANMRFSPEYLVSFHSQMMPLFPGDIISSGTPGALVVAPGDVAECDIPGVGVLRNPVIAQEAGGPRIKS